MIRKAVLSDIDKIEQSYTELLTNEKENGGFSNWVLGVYPVRETAQNALDEDSLYVLEEDCEICASVILNSFQAEDYKKVNWKYSAADSEVMVIHTLCIPPSKAGRGYGKAMVSFAFDKAKSDGFKVIRLDTFAGNEPAKRLYTGMGCIISGELDVNHQGVIKERQVFLEREVN